MVKRLRRLTANTVNTDSMLQRIGRQLHLGALHRHHSSSSTVNLGNTSTSNRCRTVLRLLTNSSNINISSSMVVAMAPLHLLQPRRHLLTVRRPPSSLLLLRMAVTDLHQHSITSSRHRLRPTANSRSTAMPPHTATSSSISSSSSSSSLLCTNRFMGMAVTARPPCHLALPRRRHSSSINSSRIPPPRRLLHRHHRRCRTGARAEAPRMVVTAHHRASERLRLLHLTLGGHMLLRRLPRPTQVARVAVALELELGAAQCKAACPAIRRRRGCTGHTDPDRQADCLKLRRSADAVGGILVCC